MKKIIFLMTCLATLCACSDKVDCDCMITYVPNDHATGYGYHATLKDVDKDKCLSADKNIWNREMTKIISTLETHDVNFSLGCQPM